MQKKEFYSPEFIPVFSVALLDPNLDKQDCLVLGAVYWYERLKDGVCKASNESIARVVGSKNVHAMSNSLKKLEENGYIKSSYKDEKKRNRTQIECLLGRLNKKSSHPQMTHESSTDDTLVSSTDEQNKNNIGRIERRRVAHSVREEKTSKFSTLGAEVLDLFVKNVNPACKRYYGRKDQRQACDDLIEIHGFDRLKSLISETLPKTNKIAWLPTVTTPVQLLDRYSALEAGIIKMKNKVEQKLPNVMFS